MIRHSIRDSVLIKVIFHTLKTELVYQTHYLTREVAKQSLFQYIEVYYNQVRRHSAIDSKAPLVFEYQSQFSA